MRQFNQYLLNADTEDDKLVNADRYARDEERKGYRSGHYDRSFTTSSGEVKLRMPKLEGLTFETSVIERYKRHEISVKEALIEMYLAGVSVRRVEDISEILSCMKADYQSKDHIARIEKAVEPACY